jgi:hypothetical protein
LENAERLKLKKSEESVAMKLMEPMKPLKPMGSMRAMEMRKGGMHVSMGALEKEAQTAKRFCTQCGKPFRMTIAFCASCGHALSEQK